MGKLISMTDFVLQQVCPDHLEEYEFQDVYTKISKYASFLKQPLELWMFVPCKLVDGVWVVLEEPSFLDRESNVLSKWDEYKKAKDMVLFEGFYYSINDTVLSKNKLLRITFVQQSIIEDLVKYNLKLTPTALKQIGL